MDKDVSCLVTRSLIGYVEEATGTSNLLLDNIHPELDGVANPRAFLTDDHNWVSNSLLKVLFERSKELTGDDSVAMKAGLDAVSKKRLGYVQELFMKAVTTPAMGLKRSQTINDKFNRTKRVELVQLFKNGGIIKLHWSNSPDTTEDFCRFNQGIYVALTTVWGLPPLHLEETQCYFRGDSCCEYHLEWSPGSRRLFFKRLLMSLIPTYRYFRRAVAELEKERNLLEKKFAEAHGLTFKLDEKIKRLNAIQEATRVVVSTTDLKEVLTEVMKLMVKVTGFERAVLMMVDEEEGVLKFGQGVGADEEQIEKFANYKVPLTRMSNLMVQVAHQGMPTYVDNVSSSELNLDNPLIKEFIPSSFLLVPVTVRDKVIGVLAADKGSTRATITQDDQDYLIAFVNQIAGAIENSRLIEHNRKNYLSGIKSLVTALEARDAYTRGHSERVTYYSMELANLLDLPPSRIDLLTDIVPLHDIGKLGLPDSLLLKMTPLEKHELEAIRNHTVLGEQIVAQLSLDREGLAVIRSHHEWFNGEGYPDGLVGIEIPDMARIVSITDAFDAMTTRRPYRAGMSIRGAINQLELNANTQFDPIIVGKFAEAIKAGLIKLPGNIPQL